MAISHFDGVPQSDKQQKHHTQNNFKVTTAPVLGNWANSILLGCLWLQPHLEVLSIRCEN